MKRCWPDWCDSLEFDLRGLQNFISQWGRPLIKRQPMARTDSKCSPVAKNIHQSAFMSVRAEAGMIKFNRHAKYPQHTPSPPLYLSDCQLTQSAPCNLTLTFWCFAILFFVPGGISYPIILSSQCTMTLQCIIPVPITHTKEHRTQMKHTNTFMCFLYSLIH